MLHAVSSNLLMTAVKMTAATPDTGGGATSDGFITNSILTNLISFLAPVLGIALVIYSVIQGFKLFQGAQGASLGKLLGGIATILFLLGVMYAAGSFEAYGRLFQGVTDNVVNQFGDDTNNVLG